MSATPLATAVGTRMRELRDERTLRQDDVAVAARGLGFRWTRAAVARLEAGQRRLSAAEFLFLPEMLNFAMLKLPADQRRRVVELADLLPEQGWISLTSETQVRASALRMFLRGQLQDVNTTELSVPLLRGLVHQAKQLLGRMSHGMAERENIRQAIWPEASEIDIIEAAHDAAGEAEQKAALRLQVPAFAIALEARRRWQRSLSVERDRRLAGQASETGDRRTVQAIRGHITRALLAELEDLPTRLSEADVLRSEPARPSGRRPGRARRSRVSRPGHR